MHQSYFYCSVKAAIIYLGMKILQHSTQLYQVGNQLLALGTLSVQNQWQTRDGEQAGSRGQPVPEIGEHLGGQRKCPISDLPGECALWGGQGCGPEEAAGREAGEEAEAGEGGSLDGQACMGQAWPGGGGATGCELM